jgi:hypothetical protein
VFGYLQCVIDFDPEIARSAFELGVSEQHLHRPQVLRVTADEGMERRLYEIARKHCGHQTSWKVGLALLHKKSGSSGTQKEFRRKVKGIAKSNHMPDYRIVYDSAED